MQDSNFLVAIWKHVKAGLIPSWTGSEQVRPFQLDYGRTSIEAGKQKLTWERAVKHA